MHNLAVVYKHTIIRYTLDLRGLHRIHPIPNSDFLWFFS